MVFRMQIMVLPGLADGDFFLSVVGNLWVVDNEL